jgi:hypothetical protein
MKSASAVKPPQISTLINQHFKSLQILRDSFFAAHAGLLGLSEAHYERFESGLPVFFKRESVAPNFETIRYQAQVSLLRATLFELRRLNGHLLEEIRRFMEFKKLASSKSTADEKKLQFKKILESQPKTLKTLIDSVAALFPNGFHGSSELKSLLAIEKLLEMSLRNAPTNISKPAKARLAFLRPESSKPDPDGAKKPLRIASVGLELDPSAKISIDANLIHLIFFTSYGFALSISQKLKDITK